MPALSPVCGPGTCTSNVQEECFFDPNCGVAGVDQLGCNAGGRPQCRFCGFQGGFPCPSPSSSMSPLPLPFPPPFLPPSMPALSPVCGPGTCTSN
eukprot:5566186-Pleurochrysis_carterae.AAC.1